MPARSKRPASRPGASGGNLRDALLQQAHSDYDIATSATPEQVQALFPRTIAVGIKYGTVGVLDRARVLHEVTTFRRDVSTDGRHAVVAYGATLEEDLARRDFTINAIAYHPLRREWRDPFDGAGTSPARLVRAVGDPARAIPGGLPPHPPGDPLRGAVRLHHGARHLGGGSGGGPGLRQLSAERVRDEWFKSLRTARSITQLVMLWVHVGAARRVDSRAGRSSEASIRRSPIHHRNRGTQYCSRRCSAAIRRRCSAGSRPPMPRSRGLQRWKTGRRSRGAG